MQSDEINSLLKTNFQLFDVELSEERFPSVFSKDKSYLQSSKGMKKYIDLEKVDFDLKDSRWHVVGGKV